MDIATNTATTTLILLPGMRRGVTVAMVMVAMVVAVAVMAAVVVVVGCRAWAGRGGV
jgi:hypothetical protein